MDVCCRGGGGGGGKGGWGFSETSQTTLKQNQKFNLSVQRCLDSLFSGIFPSFNPLIKLSKEIFKRFVILFKKNLTYTDHGTV